LREALEDRPAIWIRKGAEDDILFSHP
jgi:hypothetical protein